MVEKLIKTLKNIFNSVDDKDLEEICKKKLS